MFTHGSLRHGDLDDVIYDTDAAHEGLYGLLNWTYVIIKSLPYGPKCDQTCIEVYGKVKFKPACSATETRFPLLQVKILFFLISK